MKFLLTKKIGMTQFFNEDGKVVPVTLVEAFSNNILRIKNKEKDGYAAYVVGVGLKKGKEGKKQVDFKKVLEFKFSVDDESGFEVGKELNADVFAKNDEVTLSGISKGKGFQGVVKRYNFKGGPASHGHKHNLRQPGSIGSVFPMRVIKGKKMAGRMGTDKITIQTNVLDVSAEERIIAVKGAVPGAKGGWIKIVGN